MDGSINHVPDEEARRDREVLFISCQAGRVIIATGIVPPLSPMCGQCRYQKQSI